MLDAGKDQAASLRQLFGAATLRVLPIVGSASLTEMCARTLAGERRVVVLDHGGDEIARAFGRPIRFDLAALLWGDRSFEDVATRVNDRLSIVSAKAGLDQYIGYAREHSLGSDSLFAGFLRLSQPFEWLVMHTRSLACAAELLRDSGEVVFVIDDADEAVKDAYARIKESVAIDPNVQLRLVVKAASEVRARNVFNRVALATERFLGFRPQYGMALRTPMRASTQLSANLRTAMTNWNLAEFSAPSEAQAAVV